jgi:hypothetical protein
MNIKAEKAVKILKEYAVEGGVSPRSTSDLSSLEEWLLLRLINIGYEPKDITYESMGIG